MAIAFGVNCDLSFIGGGVKPKHGFLHFISPAAKNCLINGHQRSFIFESHDVFKRLCGHIPTNSMHVSQEQHSTLELLAFSRQYCSIIRSFCQKLEKELLAMESGDSLNLTNILQSYKCTELVWTLSELLFMQPSGGSIAVDLIKWASWNFTNADNLAKLALADLGSILDPNLGENYWNAIFLFILHGRHRNALELLGVHPGKGDASFRSIDELLRKVPLSKLTTDPIEYKLWQNECRRRLDEGHYKAYPNLEIIAKILSGSTEIFSELSSLIPTWYECIVPLVLYLYPQTDLVALANVAEEAIKINDFLPESGPLPALDAILISLFDLDVLQALSHMSRFSGDWWLPAHLAHILHLCGCLDLGQEDNFASSMNLSNCEQYGSIRDYLLLEYAQFIMKDLSLLQVAMPYCLACGDLGSEMFQNYLLRVPVNGDKKTLIILSECNKYGFDDVSQSICRRKTMQALRDNHLANALAWCFKAKDPVLATTVAERCLDMHEFDVYKGMHVLENLADNALLSPLLIFLSKHREFSILNEMGKKSEAGALLVDLVTSQLAPRKLWVPLLINANQLLSEEEVYFDMKQTYALIELVERMLTETRTLKSQQFAKNMQKGEFDIFVKTVRAALVDNLARNVK